MALSGRINGSVTAVSSHFSFYADWSAVQNIAENKSIVTVTTFWKTDNTSYTFDTVGRRNANIDINGTNSAIYQAFDCNPWPAGGVFQIQTFTVEVPHNADGTKSITISVRANGHAWYNGANRGPSNSTNSSGDCTASATITLDTIVRTAEIGYATAQFTRDAPPYVQYSNPAGDSVDSLEMAIGNPYDDEESGIDVPFVQWRSVPKTGSSYTFEFSAADKAAINEMTVGSHNVRISIKTTIGSSVTYDYYDTVLVVQSGAGPQLSISVTTINPSTIASKFASTKIQGVSSLRVNVTATSRGSAVMTGSVRVQIDGQMYARTNVTTGVIQKTEIEIIAYAADVRGNTSSLSQIVTLEPYFRPSVAPIDSVGEIQVYRSTSAGVADDDSTSVWVKAKRKYASVNGLNTCVLQVRTKPNNQSQWGQWQTLLAGTATTDDYSGLISGTFSTDNAYDVQIGVVDDIGIAFTIDRGITVNALTWDFPPGGNIAAFLRNADTSKGRSFQVGANAYFDGVIYLKSGNEFISLEDYIRSIIT